MAMSEEQIAAAQRRLKGGVIDETQNEAKGQAKAEAQPAAPATDSPATAHRWRALRQNIKQRPWLHLSVALLLAVLFAAAVQVVQAPFWDVADSSAWNYRAMLGLALIMAAFFFMPNLKPRSSWLAGFAMNSAYFTVYFVVTIAASLAVVEFESRLSSQTQQQTLVAAEPAAAEQRLKQAQEQLERFELKQQQKKLARQTANSELAKYQLPITKSACPLFFVDFNQPMRVQDFLKLTDAFAIDLGNCLHDEAKANFSDLEAYVKKQKLGSFAFYNDIFPETIKFLSGFTDFSTNSDRCDLQCSRRVDDLLKEIEKIADKQRQDFLLNWDGYVALYIKPALKESNPTDYNNGEVAARLNLLRFSYEDKAFMAHGE